MESKEEINSPLNTGKAPAKVLKGSIIDASVATGLCNSLPKYSHLFTEQEAKLIQFFANVGQQSLAGLAKGLIQGLSVLPTAQNAFFDYTVVYGYKELMAIRNRFLKTTIEQAITDGYEQIVILPGGYDILALTIALEYPGVTVYELNRSPTYEFKTEAIKHLPEELKFKEIDIKESPDKLTINNNLHYGQYEPNQDLFEVLSTLDLDRNKPTYFILPRYTMYLEPTQNTALLQCLQKNTKEEDRILISYAEKMPTHSSIAKFFTSKQPYQCFLPINQSIQFLNEQGFRVDARFDIYSPLEDMGAKEIADFHKNNPSKPTEQFYMLYPQKDLSKQERFEDLRKIELVFPEKPTTEEQPSSCFCI